MSDEPRDYNREAAHRRYDKAAQIAHDAGSDTQGGLNEAYQQLYQNANWTPPEGWAQDYQEGAQAYAPNVIKASQVQPVSQGWNGGSSSVSPEAPNAVSMDGFSFSNGGKFGLTEEEEREAEEQRAKDTERAALNPNFDPNYDPRTSFAGTIDSWSNWSANPSVESNRVYNDLFMEEGYQPDQQDNWWDHLGNWFALSGAGTNPDLLIAQYNDPATFGNPEDTLALQKQSGDEFMKAVSGYHEQGVDDGSLNQNNFTSNFMTGEQYIKYREAGIPGLDVEEIDPNAIYNKRNEQSENGFEPYVPDDATYWKMATQNVLAMPSDAAAWLRGARDELTDYTIDIDGRKVSGKDFNQDEAYDYYNKAIEEYNSKANENPTSYEIVDEGGNVVFEMPTNATAVSAQMNDDGTIDVYLSDGSGYNFDGEGYASAEEEVNYIFNNPGNMIRPKGVNVDVPDYVTDDGESFTFDEVGRILNDMAYMTAGENKKDLDDEGINYDFGPANIGKPSSMLGGGGGILSEDFAPNMIDLASSSAPYFVKQVAFPVGLSDAYMASRDVNPMYTKGRTYKGIGEIDDETRAIMEEMGIDVDAYEDYRHNGEYGEKILANAIMPFTEYGWGNIGTKFTNPLIKGAKRMLGDQTWMPWANQAMGVVGEGLEEIPGNWVEEATQNGFTKSWYADYLRDKGGNILYDTHGFPLKAQEGEFDDRMGRFAEDAPEAFLGGSVLGGAFALPGVRRTYRESKDISEQNKREREAGYDPYMYDLEGERPDFDVDFDDRS